MDTGCRILGFSELVEFIEFIGFTEFARLWVFSFELLSLRLPLKPLEHQVDDMIGIALFGLLQDLFSEMCLARCGYRS